MITELLSPFSEGEAAALAGQAAVRLGDWYRENARRLPWREKEPAESYPYRVWVSEIMLQQTRVEAVIPYYRRFLAAFPDIPSLAAAEDDKLRKLWEGLGYYSRARNLKKGAVYLMERGGRLPADIDGLRQVPASAHTPPGRSARSRSACRSRRSTAISSGSFPGCWRRKGISPARRSKRLSGNCCGRPMRPFRKASPPGTSTRR